jgi:hypothetical protein
MLVLLLVLNLILAAIVGIFTIKNFIVNFKVSKSKLKNIVMIFFIISTLVLSLSGALSAVTVNDNINQLTSDLTKADNAVLVQVGNIKINKKGEIQMQLDLENGKKIQVLRYTALGWIFFACLWTLHRNILKEISETKKTGSWDLSKFK